LFERCINTSSTAMPVSRKRGEDWSRLSKSL